MRCDYDFDCKDGSEEEHCEGKWCAIMATSCFAMMSSRLLVFAKNSKLRFVIAVLKVVSCFTGHVAATSLSSTVQSYALNSNFDLQTVQAYSEAFLFLLFYERTQDCLAYYKQKEETKE